MHLFYYILIGMAALLVGGIAAMLFVTVPIAKRVYFEKQVRTDKEKWGRVCSAPENEEQLDMWNKGLEWGKENSSVMREVNIKSGELTLWGEYYDFGSDRCVIIMPGRCECLMYSYFYAEPYKKAGMNVIVADSRAHGRSDGVYSTAGVMEAEDVKAWMRFAATELGNSKIWLHGICVGGVTMVLAASAKDCPKELEGIVTDGCFVSMREIFKQHMIDEKRPIFPVLDLMMLNFMRYAKVNVYKNCPIKKIDKVKCRALFLFGKKDIFSLPAKSRKLFDKCGSDDKKLVWFDKGGHSHLRINNTEKYDKEIIEFVNHE